MRTDPDLLFIAARAFLDLWDELGPEVLGQGDAAAIDALRAVVEEPKAMWFANVPPANVLPL